VKRYGSVSAPWRPELVRDLQREAENELPFDVVVSRQTCIPHEKAAHLLTALALLVLVRTEVAL